MRNVTMQEFHEDAQNGNIKIVDVRPKKLFDEGHVPGAVHIPLSEIEKSLDQLDKDEHYYMICHNGKGSKKATELLDSKGYNVTNVEKGVPHYPGELEV